MLFICVGHGIGTDRSEQTVLTQIRLFLLEPSELGLQSLQFYMHFFNALNYSELQIRGGIHDNSRIIFLISQ